VKEAKIRQQVISVTSLIFAAAIIPDRLASGSYGWALFWAVVAALHVKVLRDISADSATERKS
jgi:hypothetical protein